MERKGLTKKIFVIIVALVMSLCGNSNGQTVRIRPVAFEISFQGLPWTDYVVQQSTNMIDWQTSVIVSGNSSGVYSYTNFPGDQTKMFYRTVVSSGNVWANLSLDASSPLAEIIPVEDTVNGQVLGKTVLVFDLNAQNGSVIPNGIGINFQASGSGTIVAAYLCQGSTRIQSASVVGSKADFTNLKGSSSVIPANYTMPFSVQIDVTGIVSSNFTVIASANHADFDLQDQNGHPIGVVGTALGNAITIAPVGPLFTLAAPPTITSYFEGDNQGHSVTTFVATFDVNVTSIGENVTLGLNNSTAPAFADDSSLIAIFKNGVKDNLTNYMVGVVYSQPAGTISLGDDSFLIPNNISAYMTVSYIFTVSNGPANIYALQVEGIRWSSNGATKMTVFGDDLNWRSPYMVMW